jgi:oxygen-independent coproporphyrinogen-3 oxidase
MNCGVELTAIQERFGRAAVDDFREVIAGLAQRELLVLEDGWLRLTPRGRLLSNDVFEEFLCD